MEEWFELKALSAVVESLDLVPSTHMETPSCLHPQLQESCAPLVSPGPRHTSVAQTGMQAKQTKQTRKSLFV